MIRISGVNIDPKKQARFALTPIKGIGKNNVKQILSAVKIPIDAKLGEIGDDKIVELRKYIDEFCLVEADLRRKTNADIKRLIDIKCWRGYRHTVGLPVRGQRTKTNSKTRRGKKTVSPGGKKK